MTRSNDRIIDYTKQLPRDRSDDDARHGNDTGDSPLPTSRGADAVTVDRDGIRNHGYLDKYGTPRGLDAALLHLPPGMNIENQACSRADEAGDIPYKEWKGYEKGYVEVGDANRP